MHPAKAPLRASINAASVDGNTAKFGRDRRRLARISHVARRILQSDDPLAECIAQAPDQRDRPCTPNSPENG